MRLAWIVEGQCATGVPTAWHARKTPTAAAGAASEMCVSAAQTEKRTEVKVTKTVAPRVRNFVLWARNVISPDE